METAPDAAAATGFALALFKPHQSGIAGEVPTLVYSAAEKRVRAVSGHGAAPREVTPERHLAFDLEVIPGDGFLPAIVAPAVATYVLLLERFGTLRLADVPAPAVELAEGGFSMYDALYEAIADRAGLLPEGLGQLG